MRRIALVIALLVCFVPVSGRADAGSLPSVSVGPRPGPAVLYEPLASAPMLDNANGWEAVPLMVSGTDAYTGGEYVYQDYIYDAYGANTTNLTFTQPETVPNSSDTAFGGMSGDLSYPTDVATYGNNAADILEFRARLVPEGIAYRITLNTMLDDDVAGVAIGRSYTAGGATDWGHGLGDLGAAVDDVVLTWGTGARLGANELDTSADVTRNQIDVVAPLPEGVETVEHFLVAGLFDPTTISFKQIGDQPTATQPGGAQGTTPPPVFNVGFRFEFENDEPMGSGADAGPNSLGGRGVGFGHFRDHGQATALAARDISAFSVTLNLSDLLNEVDRSRVPQTGYLNRLYVSHLSLGEGARTSRPMLVGPIQPYALYVPTTYEPGIPAPLHLHLHSLSSAYNQYAVYSPNTFTQLGEERGAIVLSPEGRGPDGWWHDEAEVDIFEAWADVAARYDLDADRTSVGGYSMGGYGTYRMTTLYPDLFASGFSTVGPADEDILGGPTGGESDSEHNTWDVAENLRNLPLLLWHGAVDELVPVLGAVRFADHLKELGLQYEMALFPADHFALAEIDQWGPGRDFIGDALVDRNPDTIVYRTKPDMGNEALGLVHDKAYWISDITPATGAASGLVKAQSFGFGQTEGGAVHEITPGTDPLPHLHQRQIFLDSVLYEPRNELRIALTDVASATVWIERAQLDPGAPLLIDVVSNGSGTVTLAGTFGTMDVPYSAGNQEVTVEI